MKRRCILFSLACGVAAISGCATMKETDTARTGVEQLLISSATDQALDKIDLAPVRGASVYIESKYLDCVDKNYVLISLRQRLMQQGCTLVEKPEESDVTIEVGSGGVGTDRNELFVGIPEIPLPPPSPISLPRVAIFTRAKAMGTAKLRLVAYDTKTKQSVIDSGFALARSDYKHWNVLGGGPVVTGRVPDELYAATGEAESVVPTPSQVARRHRDAPR